MYDKFVGFVDDLDSIGKSIQNSQKFYDEAYKKLTTGNGNLVRSAQRVKELGVKPNKSLPNALIDKVQDE